MNYIDIYRRYLVLKKIGKQYAAKCPFHPDRTPSFFVDPGSGLWYCFGCGRGGNVYTFLKNIDPDAASEIKIDKKEILKHKLQEKITSEFKRYVVALEYLDIVLKQIIAAIVEKYNNYEVVFAKFQILFKIAAQTSTQLNFFLDENVSEEEKIRYFLFLPASEKSKRNATIKTIKQIYDIAVQNDKMLRTKNFYINLFNILKEV